MERGKEHDTKSDTKMNVCVIKDMDEGKNLSKKPDKGGNKGKKEKKKSKAGARGGTRSSGLDQDALCASGILPEGVDVKSLREKSVSVKTSFTPPQRWRRRLQSSHRRAVRECIRERPQSTCRARWGKECRVGARVRGQGKLRRHSRALGQDAV